MKKKFLLLVILPAIFLACGKTNNPLGVNANITQVGVSVGFSGDTLTITGTGFTNASQLSGTFNGIPITVLNASTTQLVASIPFTTSTAGVISILNGTSTTPITFDYSLSITAISVSPGPSGTGTTLTITGDGFVAGLSGLQVSYAGQTFTVTSSSATQIIATNATYPPFSLVGGQVSIGIPGQHIGTPFLMAITSLTPSSGLDGTSVMIAGYGFSADKTKDIVKFNGTPAVVNSATATLLNVTAPAGGTSGPVSVTFLNSTAIGTSFTYPMDVSTFAGSGMAGSADGQGTNASFRNPENGAFDKNGNLFVADYGNNEIREVTPSGVVTTFAGSTSAGYKDGQASQALFSGPSGVCFDTKGNLYVSDELNNRIRKIDGSGNVTTIAGSGIATLHDANGTSASFNRPIGLAFDSLSGMLIIADSRNNAIRMLNLANSDVFTLAGSGQSGSADETEGNPVLATFNSPRGIALFSYMANGSEWLYATVADYGNNKIREVLAVGSLSGSLNTNTYTIAGDPNNQPGNSNSGNPPVKFSGPNSLSLGFYPSIAGPGTPVLFIGDASNHLIRYALSETNNINGGTMDFETLAGTASPGLTNGSYTNAQFNYPDGVAFNPVDGNLYVIEFGNNDIRKIILK
jgi:hypothetical protein